MGGACAHGQAPAQDGAEIGRSPKIHVSIPGFSASPQQKCFFPLSQKEFGKKVTKQVTEASEKVTKKSSKESRKGKKVIELLLPTSCCGTLILAEHSNQLLKNQGEELHKTI